MMGWQSSVMVSRPVSLSFWNFGFSLNSRGVWETIWGCFQKHSTIHRPKVKLGGRACYLTIFVHYEMSLFEQFAIDLSTHSHSSCCSCTQILMVYNLLVWCLQYLSKREFHCPEQSVVLSFQWLNCDTSAFIVDWIICSTTALRFHTTIHNHESGYMNSNVNEMAKQMVIFSLTLYPLYVQIATAVSSTFLTHVITHSHTHTSSVCPVSSLYSPELLATGYSKWIY